ncbi:hypothetical protein Purlil1_11814 [Purpureocillium lilacinum]|uniref:Uncharacterized protein n=1 Tax=Purpureocillium lilacinum TaxID=33203 RepID=A0ABR0BIJ3_PURLI|nr:hypothetical protein Purlil1_11814 [Purpureocillium lilacinum]
MPPKRKAKEDAGKPHYAEIAGTLADKPEIASWICSLLPASPYKSPYTPPNTLTCSDGPGPLAGAGTAATPAKREAWKHRRILPRPTLVRYPSTPPAVCAERSSPGGTTQAGQGKSAPTPNETDGEPETERRRRAKVIAASAVNQLSPENKTSLFDFRKEAAAIRSDTLEAQFQSSGTGSRPPNPAQAKVIEGISTLRRSLRGKKIVQRLAVFRKRYDRWLTAETLEGHHNAQPSADMPGQTLQAVVIAKTLLEEQVSHMSDKQVQT